MGDSKTLLGGDGTEVGAREGERGGGEERERGKEMEMRVWEGGRERGGVRRGGGEDGWE